MSRVRIPSPAFRSTRFPIRSGLPKVTIDRKPGGPCVSSVDRDGAVDVGGPEVDPPGEAADIVEASLPQELRHLQAAHSVVAVDDDDGRLVHAQCVEVNRDRLHGDVDRPIDLRQQPLRLRPAIDQHDRLAGLASAMEISRRNLPLGVEGISRGQALRARHAVSLV